METLAPYVPTLVALHLIAVISFMAGMLYLPRLFVYHTETTFGTPEYERFCTMERRLLRGIINPAMIATFLFGILLTIATGAWNPQQGVWLHVKFVLALMLAVQHAMMSRYRKAFLAGNNRHSAKYFKWFNEIPAVLMVGIIFLVELKPF